MNEYLVTIYDYNVSLEEMLEVVKDNLVCEIEVEGHEIFLTMEAEGYYDVENAMYYVTESPKIGSYTYELIE